MIRSIGSLVSCLGLVLLFTTGAGFCAEETHTPLGEQMELMSKSLRTLRRQISDPANKESSVTLLEAMEKNALKARELIPAKAKDVPEADRGTFVTSYQSGIDDLVTALRKIADDVRNGRFEAAKNGLGALQTLKRKEHEEFSAEKDE